MFTCTYNQKFRNSKGIEAYLFLLQYYSRPSLQIFLTSLTIKQPSTSLFNLLVTNISFHKFNHSDQIQDKFSQKGIQSSSFRQSLAIAHLSSKQLAFISEKHDSATNFNLRNHQKNQAMQLTTVSDYQYLRLSLVLIHQQQETSTENFQHPQPKTANIRQSSTSTDLIISSQQRVASLKTIIATPERILREILHSR